MTFSKGSIHSPQNNSTSLVALIDSPQPGQIYFRVEDGFFIRVPGTLSVGSPCLCIFNLFIQCCLTTNDLSSFEGSVHDQPIVLLYVTNIPRFTASSRSRLLWLFSYNTTKYFQCNATFYNLVKIILEMNEKGEENLAYNGYTVLKGRGCVHYRFK